MTLELTAEQIEELKGEAATARWTERCEYFERVLQMSAAALARTERELGEVRHNLKQSEVIAQRYPELLRTILSLADLCDDIPFDLALVVQEAQAVVGCVSDSDKVK